ncbi:Cystatin_domain-containing protein [Hexamita inflata]|uniref:Cystatin domain-containing protein n=1 Tax=Hexamita inflata TaxID=28002 RepID=A0AA86NP55_9EUKA|nr:Cystatin domain-containing protein [Hexamita inflata]
MLFLLYSTQMVGGFTERSLDSIDPKIMSLVSDYMLNTIKQNDFKITSVQSQVVAGINFKFAVEFGEKHAILVVFRSLSQQIEVSSYTELNDEM